MKHYEVHYSNEPLRGEEILFFNKKSEATRKAKELAVSYNSVLVEKVYLSDEDTYEDFQIIAEYENGKNLKVVNIK